jgi:hypothetical protein
MELDKALQVFGSLSKLIEDSETIPLHSFASKLEKAANTFPEDYTIGMLSDVVDRMLSNKRKVVISRAEIRDLYNKFYSRNSKFATTFADELALPSIPTPKHYDREEHESYTIPTTAYETITDQVLANALGTAFGNEVRGYTDSAAARASNVCESECRSIGSACKVDVVCGNEKIVVCRASFETPKGMTSVLVPVEASVDYACLPTIFVGNNGVEDFNTANLSTYITDNAGAKLGVDAGLVLTASTGTEVSEISDVDLALTRLNASKEHNVNSPETKLEQELVVMPAQANWEMAVKTASVMSAEAEAFGAGLDSAEGVAGFTFGKENVEASQKAIADHLRLLGYNDGRVAVADVDEKGLVFAASINSGRTTFKIPVGKDSLGSVPEMIISNGGVHEFNQLTLDALSRDGICEYRVAGSASALYGLKASDLVDTVRVGMNEKNYAKVEDALNVLATYGDEKAYKSAFEIYMGGLGKEAGVEEKSTCGRVLKSANSMHPVCGHLGLPLHKVYQDKNGNCKPLYRRGMDETYDGAVFNNSKVFI